MKIFQNWCGIGISYFFHIGSFRNIETFHGIGLFGIIEPFLCIRTFGIIGTFYSKGTLSIIGVQIEINKSKRRVVSNIEPQILCELKQCGGITSE